MPSLMSTDTTPPGTSTGAAWDAYRMECRRLDAAYMVAVDAVRKAGHTERMEARSAAMDAWRQGMAAAQAALTAQTAEARGVSA
jgi:hypothetical protein